MNLGLNFSIIGLLIGAVVFWLFFRVIQNKKDFNNNEEQMDRVMFTYPAILDYIKKRMTEITTANLYLENLSEDEFKRRTRRRKELKDALKNCNTGDFSSKIYVKEYMYDLLLKEYNFDDENILWTIPFDNPNLMSIREKFETILYVLGKKHGKNAIGYLIETYELANPKEDGGYRIEETEIQFIYKQIMRGIGFSFEDKLRVITQVIYSQYKGFGIIDEVRDMSIDGVSGGVSGLPSRMDSYQSDVDLLSAATKKRPSGMNSAWIMYKGKSIHLEFLSFEHEAELKRVVTNVYKYGHPGQLSESRPSIINEMHDGSRVVVMRPKLAESWAFFIRKKYDAKVLTLNDLIKHPNNDLPIQTLQYLMKGNRTTAVTGAQGSGKSTLLMALIAYIHPALNLRIQETAFELNLRSLYPGRNILSFQETDSMSGQAGLDLQKKTDGHVTILGEVATDPVAAWMIQSAQVASLFTIFTHHAKTFPNLVEALRNSLLKTGMFNNESIAEQQVVNVLEFNVHKRQDFDGSRYIEHITECVPIAYEDESVVGQILAKANTRSEKMDALIQVATTYFRQQTQRKHYIERTVLRFENGQYVPVEPISETRQQEIAARLSPEEREEFFDFVKQHWGTC